MRSAEGMTAEFVKVTTCPVCGSSGFWTAFTRGDFSGKLCGTCGMIYISPVRADPTKLYTDDRSSSPSSYYEHSFETDRKTFSKRLELLENFIKEGTILDIGCSTGAFIQAAKDRAWNRVIGIDPNPVSAAICRKHDLDIIEAFFNEDTAKEMESFDILHLGDIIEHFTDPVRVLELTKMKLNENGLIMIVTPNFESYIARKFQIKPVEHLLYFNESSLRYLLSKCGLNIIHFEKTTRMRAFKALGYSTTFRDKPLSRILLKFFKIPGMSSLFNFLFELFVKDELLVICRKK